MGMRTRFQYNPQQIFQESFFKFEKVSLDLNVFYACLFRIIYSFLDFFFPFPLLFFCTLLGNKLLLFKWFWQQFTNCHFLSNRRFQFRLRQISWGEKSSLNEWKYSKVLHWFVPFSLFFFNSTTDLLYVEKLKNGHLSRVYFSPSGI